MFLLKHVKPVIVSCRKNFLKSFVLTRCVSDIPYEDVSLVSSTIIKKSLNSHKISFEEGFTCFIVGCQICNKKDCGKARNVYINKSTGMFMCCLCKGTGQWSDFESIIGGKKKKTSNVESLQLSVDHVKLNESLKGIKKVTESVLYRNDLDSLSNKFGLPVISKHILKVLDIRIDESQQNLYFPLENITSEIVGYRRVNQETKEDSTLPDLIYGGLLIGKPSRNKDTAILVPNISDFISLFNAKLSQYVVCLPNGVNNLSQYVLPTLERFKTLILWFGDDLKSWDSARHFAKKLGEQRCLFIRPDSKNLLPHLVQDQDFKTIINSAQPIWHKSITNFASLRQDILSDLQNIDKVEGVKWKRYPALNKILKGHRRGELTVVTGPTGSGKTTFMSEYSLDLAMQGVNTLWGSFEIQNVRLARTMLQQLAGLPLDENLGVFDSWADKFELLPIYFMTFYGQQSIKVVMDAVEHATYVHDIAHVIIDNVQFMMGMNEEHKNMDRFWTQDVIIASFRNFATKQNCHVSLVIHPRKEKDQEDLTTSSIFGGAKASQEADNVLIIQDKRLTSVRGKKYLQVCKNRYSGDLGVMPLDFDKSSLSFVPKKRKEDKKESPEADTST